MTPQFTSQSTLMKPEPMPTVHCDPLHSSSHLILSMDNLDKPDNPGPNTDHLPSITNQGTQASIPTSMFWASAVMGPKPTISFHQTLTLFPLIVIISCCLIPSDPVLTNPVHTLDSFTLAYPYPLTLDYDT